MWRTGVMPDCPEVLEALGLAPRDAVVGFVYLVLPMGPDPANRSPRPGVAELSVWRGW